MTDKPRPWTDIELDVDFKNEPVWMECSDCGQLIRGKITHICFFDNINEWGVQIDWDDEHPKEKTYRQQDYLQGRFHRTRLDPDE